MVMYGHVWPCIVMYGREWSCMVMYGHLWSCMVMECHKWLFMVLWSNKWNFGTTGNMGSIENKVNIGKTRIIWNKWKIG